jgi:hypothetical protein
MHRDREKFPFWRPNRKPQFYRHPILCEFSFIPYLSLRKQHRKFQSILWLFSDVFNYISHAVSNCRLVVTEDVERTAEGRSGSLL